MLQKAMGKEDGFDAQALNDKLEPNALIEVDLTEGKVTVGAWYGKRATLWKFGKGKDAGTADDSQDVPVNGPATDPSTPAPDSTSTSTTQSSTASASSSPGTGGPTAPDAATDARATTSGEGPGPGTGSSKPLPPTPPKGGGAGGVSSPRTGEGGAE